MTAGIAAGVLRRGKTALDRDDWTVRVLLLLLTAFFLIALAIPLYLMVPLTHSFRRVTVPVCLPVIFDISIYLFLSCMTTLSAVIFRDWSFCFTNC